MLFYVSLSVLLVSVQPKFWTDCGSKGIVQKVEVSGCAEDAKECVLKRNTNATFSIDFTPSNKIKSLQAVVYGHFYWQVAAKYPVPQPDACKDSNLSCPLPENEEAHYRTTMPILKWYPKIRITVKWELRNEKDKSIVCVKIPARIK